MTPAHPDVSAVVLAYQDEPMLEECVHSLLASEGVRIEVVVVDNGCTDGGVGRVAGLDGVVVVRPGENLGFAGGNNAGARQAVGEVLALVNADAVVAPAALAELSRVARRPDVGLVSGSIRLAHAPDRFNNGGHHVHFLGFGWCGRYGETAPADEEERDVPAASGAGLAIRRALWNEMGGFDDRYFIYYEDTELSLRCWIEGKRVVYVPRALVMHNFEAARSHRKQYLTERNRLVMVLTVYEARTLLMLSPVLLAMEVAVLVRSVGEGWWRPKVQGWLWLARHRRWLRERRAFVQARRRYSDAAFAGRLSPRLDPGTYPLPNALKPLDRILALYWSLVRRSLDHRG